MDVNKLKYHNDEMKIEIENLIVLGKLLGYTILIDNIFDSMYLTFMNNDGSYTLNWLLGNDTIHLLELNNSNNYGNVFNEITNINAIEELKELLN